MRRRGDAPRGGVMDQRLDAAIPPGLSIPGNRSAHSSVAAPNLDRAFARIAAGVDVRFVYDWLGSTARAFPSFFARMRNTGVSVRVFSPLRLSSPLWIRRDHRKLLAVDGAIGFVSGLCVSDDWT